MRRYLPMTVAAALAALIVWTGPAAAQTQPARQGPAAVEQDFLTGMIPHHRGAIDMANRCVMKAVHSDLRELCEKIARDQNREKDLMAGYLKSWYGMEPPLGNMMPPEQMNQMMPMHHGTMPDMAARMRMEEQKTGADFEIQVMSDFVDHHSQAIMMAAPVLISAEHPELYPLAQQIVKQQAEEIEKLLKWLEEWYGVKRPI